MTSTVLSKHGESWQNWILDNLKKGCKPQGMYSRMVAKVWQDQDAATALDEGLAALNMPAQWRKALPTIDEVKLPAGLRVLSRLSQPKAALLDGVLSAAECQELIDYAHSKGLKRSGVVNQETGVSEAHHARTSSSVFFTRAETPLIDCIEQRLATLTGWPVENGEGLQVLRYEDGQEYRPHFDWFNPDKAGSASHLKRGGQRVGTTVMYLQTPDEGGGTSFPKVGAELHPRQGGAVFFQNMTIDGQNDEMTLHAGTPVIKGVKIVMTYWQREGAFR